MYEKQNYLMATDIYGHSRGSCTKCRDCNSFVSHPESVRCGKCNCRPVDHQKLSSPQRGSSVSVFQDAQGTICQFSGCGEMVSFDPNTGAEEDFCSVHGGCSSLAACSVPSLMRTDADTWIVEDIEDDDMEGIRTCTFMDSRATLHVSMTSLHVSSSPSLPTCAISECNNLCYADDSGHVYECCGYTHAMEHQRRQILQQNSSVIKGVTHCLLPECNNTAWPFENYCSRTHADIGKQRGLLPPQTQQTTSDQSTCSPNACIYPNCNKPKYVESDGTAHPYCGKTHAELAKQQGIFPSADKAEDQCDLEGCSRPKRRDGTTCYNYCCKDHADKDAPNREANKLLTSRAEVEKWLKQFTNLKVVKITENDHAKPPDGQLFKKFKNKALSLPKDQRRTCLAFHGTSSTNINSICTNGYDPSRRSGQSYGAGEYFATTPDIPFTYCRGGKQMLLNELLLGQAGTHHTQHGAIIVMKDPTHDLPRYIIDFQ